MRKQSRSAASFIAGLVAAGSLSAAMIPQAALAENEDRTDSATYTESRSDYWAARAAYEAKKAATQARKEAGLPDPDGGANGGDSGAPSDGAPEAPAATLKAAADGVPSNSQLAALRMCESTDNYGANTGNGYYGAYQFSAITWWWLGYTGYPHQAAPGTQDQAVRDLYAISGWSPWPACSRYLGFR